MMLAAAPAELFPVRALGYALAERLMLPAGHPDKAGVATDIQDAMWQHGCEPIFVAMAEALKELETA